MEISEFKCEVCKHKKKATGKRPLKREAKGMIDSSVWICPECGQKYVTYLEAYNYCPQCGQRIDWSEEDGEKQSRHPDKQE